jgi:two-component system CheB/CheR fusion protein
MGLKILLVEDDVDARDALALLLASDGHSLETADDGDAAVAKAAAFRPDVLICDWFLPGTRDGVETAKAIQDGGGAPVIFVTAHSLPDLRSRTRNLRVQAYLPKPIDVERLRGALEELM